MSFIASNLGTIVVSVILIVLVVLIIIKLIKNKKNTDYSCQGSCCNCAMKGNCGRK